MNKIILQNISLQFKVFHNNSDTFKQLLTETFKRKKKFENFWALKNLSFSVKEGERIGVIGKNGSGKTTLLSLISNIYTPTSGKIVINGNVAPMLQIGAGFQPEFSGRENIYFNGAVLGFSKNEIKEIEKEVIKITELEKFIDTPVKYYSTGMYMKLAFQIATSLKPDILIMDEVFAGGDENFLKKGKERLNDMIEKSKVLLLVSHNLDLLVNTCNRFIWIDAGEIKEDGDEKVISNYKNYFR